MKAKVDTLRTAAIDPAAQLKKSEARQSADRDAQPPLPARALTRMKYSPQRSSYASFLDNSCLDVNGVTLVFLEGREM
jgi:hypothetical protein